MSIAAIAGVVMAGGSAVAANQRSQAQKGVQGQAVSTADANAAARAPYNAMALTDLNQTPAQLAATYGANPTYQPISDPTLTNANNTATATLNSLTGSAPDYTKQAETELADFQAQAAPELAAALRGVNTAAGAGGRIGAEGVTTSLGNLGSDYARNLQTEEDQLIEQSMNQGEQDALAKENAAQSLSSLTYGQDANDRAAKMAAAQGAITNTLNERGQGNSLGLSLADIGVGGNNAGTYQAAANSIADVNNTYNDGMGQLFDAAGNLIPTLKPTKTATP
jgi:hypothetical protein